ncbi:MAG: sulfatase-like hydrolase/transferase [Elusimicrobiales bacterium]
MIKKNFRIFISFFILNFIFSVVLSLSYIFFSQRIFVETIFLIFSLISNTSMIYLAVLILTFSFLFFSFCFYPLAFIMFLIHILNIVDIFIYKIWGFHINSMVLNIIFTPGGIESLEQSWNVKAFFFFLCVAVIALEIFLIYLSKKIAQRNFLKPILLKFLFTIILLSVFVDKIGFAVASLYDYTIITKNRNLFPLYQPLSIRRFAEKYLGFDLKRKPTFTLSTRYSTMCYPKRDIEFRKPLKKYNIIVIVVDSMRYDMLDPDIMPYTYSFSKKSSVFKNHFSGGNCTRFGIFSLFYGLYGNYWFSMLSEKRGPVLMFSLKKQDYDFFILASAKLTFPEFNETCFVEIDKEKIYDEPYGSKVEKDIEIASKAVSYIKTKNKNSERPYFMFVFFDASHGSYDYPKDFERFKPSYGVNLLTLNKTNVLPLFNKYKNSIHFVDSLINKIITAVKENGGFKNTIIIITGDHGEAFFERGYPGHNHSYSYEEVKVPFVFYHPDVKPKIFEHRTSHIDLVPTLMEMIGVINKPDDYSQGINLFSESRRDYIAVFSWDNAGLVFDDFTLVVPFSSYGGGVEMYRNVDWKGIEVDYNRMIPYLNDFRKKAVEFIKR